MANFNCVLLLGNLTREPVMRVTPQGSQVCDFGLAINRNYRTAQGEVREEVCFVNVTSFGKQAEACHRIMRKGQPVLVEGRLRMDRWEDKRTGEARQNYTVVAEKVEFLNPSPLAGRSGGSQPSPAPSQAPAPAGARPMPPFPAPSEVVLSGEAEEERPDDAIPF